VRSTGQAICNSLSERSEPVEMPGHVDDEAARDLADFVDAVGELVAAILHVHRRIAHGSVASIDIGDA
jgi:hypothetical protein